MSVNVKDRVPANKGAGYLYSHSVEDEGHPHQQYSPHLPLRTCQVAGCNRALIWRNPPRKGRKAVTYDA